jgi:putative transposase
MAAPHSVDPVQLLEKHLASASPDLLREMVAAFANAMMSAQADQVCGADYGLRAAERVNRRNGYPRQGVGHPGEHRGVGDPEVAGGSYYPDWLFTHRRRAEQALVTWSPRRTC